MGRPLESVYTIETPVSSLPTTSNISRKQYGQKYNTWILLVLLVICVTPLQLITTYHYHRAHVSVDAQQECVSLNSPVEYTQAPG